MNILITIEDADESTELLDDAAALLTAAGLIMGHSEDETAAIVADLLAPVDGVSQAENIAAAALGTVMALVEEWPRPNLKDVRDGRADPKPVDPKRLTEVGERIAQTRRARTGFTTEHGKFNQGDPVYCETPRGWVYGKLGECLPDGDADFTPAGGWPLDVAGTYKWSQFRRYTLGRKPHA